MDASVIARVPSANTHLAVIALAERLAAAFAGWLQALAARGRALYSSAIR